MATLERAIAIAAEAHAGQLDKAGGPYILHPLRVMLALEGADDRIVGVLHDVVEDRPDRWSFDRLRREGYSETVIAALDAVTRREDESYEQFVERAARNEMGRRVKLADLTDNCDLARIADPTHKDGDRIARYAKAIAYIRGLMEREGTATDV